MHFPRVQRSCLRRHADVVRRVLLRTIAAVQLFAAGAVDPISGAATNQSNGQPETRTEASGTYPPVQVRKDVRCIPPIIARIAFQLTRVNFGGVRGYAMSIGGHGPNVGRVFRKHSHLIRTAFAGNAEHGKLKFGLANAPSSGDSEEVRRCATLLGE